MKKHTLLLLLMALLGQARAQVPAAAAAHATNDFAAFANTQHGRMIKAYEQRDIPGYQSKQAFDYLERSIRAGFINYTHIIKDPDLAELRNLSRFHTLIAPLRAVGDYPYILQRAASYDLADRRPLPAFRYEPANDSNLLALRSGLHLDSIAGGGSDVNQVIRLLHWMHDLIPHDGNNANPAVRNAMSLVAVCKRDHRGLNCRGLAIALNECYLALGYRSRYVTCMPKDSLGVDPDCHVINIVYIPSLKKWIWIDPTNDAYVMNEKGELLGIEEVRQRLIRHQPDKLDTDWGKDGHSITYNTNNPALFWAKPQ
ncbi:transglutaminase domain-containing protein [Puia sp.]|uniref:transglutaminase domain-containing protein n=1 Tax=Puia sp. TaxID=2045100 RepID=UPI002F400277